MAVNSLGKLTYVHIHIDNLLKRSGGPSRHKKLEGGIEFDNILYVVQFGCDQRFAGL